MGTKIAMPAFDDRPIWDVWLSAWWMPSLAAADELGLFEALAERPATAEELAERMDLNPFAMKALLPMLASLGLLAVWRSRYQLTEPSRIYLLHDSGFYWGHAFTVHRANQVTRNFIQSLKAKPTDPSTRNDRPADAWAAGEVGAEMARGLTAFMHSHSLPAALGVAQVGDFEGVSRVLDVGGGSGCFSIALAQAHPEMCCTIMELPHVAALAKGYIADAGVADRVDTTVVDMFREAWPTGYDAIFMSNIVHDWDLETNALLTRRSCEALPRGGRIYFHEMLINDDGTGPLAAAGYSMLMIAGTMGRQYSAAELERLLDEEGFGDFKVQDTYGHFSLVSARKR